MENLPEKYYSKQTAKKWRNWKFWFYFSLVCLVILLLIFRVIVIELTFMEENTHAVFSLITAFLWGQYLNVLGFSFGIGKKKWKIIVLIIVVIVYVWFSEYLGIRIIFNIPIFISNTFATNTAESAYFFGYNLPLWIAIWLSSLVVESEV